jgi:hypothetical protein
MVSSFLALVGMTDLSPRTINPLRIKMNLIESLAAVSNASIPANTLATLSRNLRPVEGSCKRINELAGKSSGLVDEYADDILAVVNAFDNIPSHLGGAGTLKKEIRSYLTNFCGVSKARVSKLLSVEALTRQLRENKSACLGWYESLPISSRYTLTLVSEKGFDTAWAELTKWGSISISRNDLRKLKEKHPMEQKVSPRNKSRKALTPLTFEEQAFRSQVKRCGFEGQEKHMHALISNENLPHIDNVKKAALWWRASEMSDLLSVIRQKLEIHPSFRYQLEDLLDESQTVEVDVVDDPTTATSLYLEATINESILNPCPSLA